MAAVKTERPKLKSSHGSLLKTERSTSEKPKAKTSLRSKEAPKKGVKAATLVVKEVKATAQKSARSAKALDAKEPKSLTSKELAPKSKKSSKVTSESVASPEAREMAVRIASVALEKKALGLEVLDVSGKVDYADFLVLMTGRSDRQVASLASNIEGELRKLGYKLLSVEGLPLGYWVLMDFGSVVVHVFQEDARETYALDSLWSDAGKVPVPSTPS